jgi:hypothetical protein
VELAKALVRDTPCDPKLNEKDCREAQLQVMSQLIKLLDDQSDRTEIKDFDQRQAFELILSSVLNSPDTANRLEYLTTYVYFYQYPYPSNGKIILEKEFWARFRAEQIAKVGPERKRALDATLEGVWRGMRVQIENVETTVQRSAHEIAQVSRESEQGVQAKVQPSIELGTVKGNLESVIDVSSKLKTTVSEKLLRELDRRSTWLNSNRNLLRVTQRGLDAVNVAGMLKEQVTLRVPHSITPVPYVEVTKKGVGIKATGQPIYSTVPAIAISVGVVREPYKFKRAATEKYGLPDSSDAYYIVIVSEPVKLTLWKWDRIFNALNPDDLDVGAVPHVLSRGPRLKFFDASTGLEDRLLTVPDQDSFIRELRSGIYSLLNLSPRQIGKVRCKKTTSRDNNLYLTMDLGSSFPEPIWIGKESPEGDIQGFNGTENDTLRQLYAKC